MLDQEKEKFVRIVGAELAAVAAERGLDALVFFPPSGREVAARLSHVYTGRSNSYYFSYEFLSQIASPYDFIVCAVKELADSFHKKLVSTAW